ncbi:radical SAM protein [Myxococcota bacterium]|nr:radical SAM protein [Myxococcota bacterium]MBU1383208.1 radical SAM protein [Myxococcota bacterium]MBU1496442.1 radical SAM protein [Myxococcota bacterium]
MNDVQFLNVKNSIFPLDCAYLPISRGKLLVSQSHAVFCSVNHDEVEGLTSFIQGDTTEISEDIKQRLEIHGFFGPPREAKAPSRTVQIQITNGCNLSCTYCCTNSRNPRKSEITLEDAKNVVEITREKLGEGIRVAILGGEPLLKDWALDLANYAQGLGLDVTVFSNGVPLADENIARQCAESCKKGVKFRLSLAGPVKDLCDAKSGEPRYDAVIAGINYLYAHGGECIIDLMLFPEHVDSTAAHLHELRGKLPAGVPIAFGIAYVSGREVGQDLFESRRALEESLDRIAFEAGEIIAAVKPAPLTERREGCTCALGHHLHVRSDGSLFNCFKMEEKVGHLTEEGFENALDFVRSNPNPASGLQKCSDCVLNTICGSGCRSDNYLYTGNPELPLCDTWRVRVISELLADDWVSALEWPLHHLLSEAKNMGISCPDKIEPVIKSRHLIDT